MSQPLFVPPDGGFDDALRRTHRRRLRRRATLAATAGSAAVVLVVVLGITGNGPLDSLQQEQPATQGGPRDSDAPSTPPSSSPTRIPTSVAGSAPAGPLTPASPPQIGTRPSSAASAGTTGAGTPGVSSGPEATAASTKISSPLTRTEHPYSNNSPCADTSGRAATGWCVQFPGPYTGRSSQPTTLILDLCRLPGVPGATASFPSTAEASFQLSTTSNPPTQLWLLANQHPGHAARHEVTVGSGQCLSWQVTWHNRDDQGHPIAAGDYTLAVSVDADNVADPNQISTQVYRYTVTA